MRVLGIDPGERRIGLAVSDEDGRLALPRRTLIRRSLEETLEELAREITETGVSRVVVGLPLKLDGTEGFAARRVRSFVAALAARVDVPIDFWDERLTTAAAERALSEMGVRGPKRRRVVDQSAAAILLQSYLDARAPRRAADDEEE